MPISIENLESLTGLVKQHAPKWISIDKATNIYEIVTLISGVVETFSAGKDISGKDKLDLALESFPEVVKCLIEMEILSSESGEAFLNTYKDDVEQITSIVSLVVKVSNDPNFVNAGKWTHKKVSCLKGVFCN